METVSVKSKSKREIKKNDKEKRILEAARELFLEKGIQNTSVNDIVKHAGVAKGTFYLYFKERAEIEEKLVTEESVKILQQAIHLANDSNKKTFIEKFTVGVDYIIDFLQGNGEIIEFINKNLAYAVYSTQMDNMKKGSIKSIYSQLYTSFKENICPVNFEHSEILISFITEFLGAVIYSSLVYEKPKPIQELRPHIHKMIHLMFEGYGVV